MDSTIKILEEVKKEREKQNKKWGEQNHSPVEWIAILSEKIGEASKCAVDGNWEHNTKEYQEQSDKTEMTVRDFHYSRYRKELIQVAAVAVQMVESLDRNELPIIEDTRPDCRCRSGEAWSTCLINCKRS